MSVEFLKKYTNGKKVKITMRGGDGTGIIVEFSPDGEFILLEKHEVFETGKPGKQVLLNVNLIESIEIIEDLQD